MSKFIVEKIVTEFGVEADYVSDLLSKLGEELNTKEKIDAIRKIILSKKEAVIDPSVFLNSEKSASDFLEDISSDSFGINQAFTLNKKKDDLEEDEDSEDDEEITHGQEYEAPVEESTETDDEKEKEMPIDLSKVEDGEEYQPFTKVNENSDIQKIRSGEMVFQQRPEPKFSKMVEKADESSDKEEPITETAKQNAEPIEEEYVPLSGGRSFAIEDFSKLEDKPSKNEEVL